MNASTIQNLQHKQAFLRLLIFSLATVMVWLGFSLFLSQQHTGISKELQALARPLNPNIHLEVIDQIQQKRGFPDSDLQNFSILRVIHNQDGTQSIGY